MRVDLGDVELVVDLRVKQRPAPLRLRLTFGPVREAPPAPPTRPISRPRPAHLPPCPYSQVGVLMLDTQAQDFSVALDDAKGFPTTLDLAGGDSIEWSVSPDGVVDLAVADDEMSGSVTAVAPGDAVLSVDVSLADGRTVHGSAAISVVPGGVAEVEITMGAPRDVPSGG